MRRQSRDNKKSARVAALNESLGQVSGQLARVPYTPEDYQLRGIEFGLENPAVSYFLDPGLGKSSILLAVLSVLLREGVVKAGLLVAPLTVAQSVWSPDNPHSEVNKWADFEHLRVQLLHGSNKKALRDESADLYVVNPEGLSLWTEEDLDRRGRKRKAFRLIRDLGSLPFDLLAVDESTIFKHTSTERFQRLKAMLPVFARRYILTGTPTPNGLMDLFGQIYLLDGGRALGRYISHYRTRWFYPTGYGGYTWLPQPNAEKEIREAIAPYTFRLSAAEVGKLPPVYYAQKFVNLPAKARKAYRELERKLVVEFEDGELASAKNAGVRSGKCRQIANGGIYLDDEPDRPKRTRNERRWRNLHDEKTKALLDLLEELNGHQVLVAYDFAHDLDRLKKALGKGTPHLGGGVSARERVRIESAWNAGEVPVVLVHPQSAARGLNLQAAGKAVVFHSLPWDLEAHYQLIRRLLRKNRVDPVYVYYLLARGTVDEAVYAGLQAKEVDQNSLLDGFSSPLEISRGDPLLKALRSYLRGVSRG